MDYPLNESKTVAITPDACYPVLHVPNVSVVSDSTTDDVEY